MIIGLSGNSRVLPKLTLIGTFNSTADSSSYDFGTFNVGASSVLVIAAVLGNNTDSGNIAVSSVSIGGTNGTLHIAPSGSDEPTAIASRMASGTIDVSAVFNGTLFSAAVAVYTLTGYTSATPSGSAGNNNGSTVSSVSASVTIPAYGTAVVVAGMRLGNPNTPPFSSATEDGRYNAGDGFDGSKVWGHFNSKTVLTSHTETASFSASARAGISMAVWS